MAMNPLDGVARESARAGEVAGSGGQMKATWTLAASAASTLAALAAVVLIVVHMAWANMDTGVAVFYAMWVGLLAMAAVLGVQMLRGTTVCLQALVLFWALVLAGAVVVTLHTAMWGAPGWFRMVFPHHPAALLAPALAVAAACTTLLVLASAPDSRLRYGAMVLASCAAAGGLVIVANMVAQKETVSLPKAWVRSSITSTTRSVVEGLSSLPGQVKLTCLYASTDKSKGSDEYRPDTWELLEEIRKANPSKVAVVNVTTQEAKARVLARLRQSLMAMDPERRKLLDEVQEQSGAMIAALEPLAETWQNLPKDSYVFYWARGAAVRDSLLQAVQGLRDLQAKLKTQQFNAALPDYAALTEQARAGLKDLHEVFSGQADWLKRLSGLPKAVAANRKQVEEAVAQADRQVKAARAALGAGAVPPEQAAKVLETFAAEARKASEQINKAADALDIVAGEGDRDLVTGCRALFVPIASGMSMYAGEVFRLVAGPHRMAPGALSELAEQAAESVKRLKPEVQVQAISALREAMTQVGDTFTEFSADLGKRLDRVSGPTAADQSLLATVGTGDYFKGVTGPGGRLLEQFKNLPDQKDAGTPEKLKDDNLIVIEADGRVDVVSFDEVWRLARDDSRRPSEADKKPRREFDGDVAVRSHLMRLVHKEPFATVLLTYYEPKTPPEARQMGGGNPPDDVSVTQGRNAAGPGMPGNDLSVLTTRLEMANFEVKKWNLIDPMPDEAPPAGPAASRPTTRKARPRILLVLPILKQGPMAFGPPQERIVRDTIDSGVPAIFLTHFVTPRQMSMELPPASPVCALADYLSADWGIRVASNSRIIAAAADPDEPGKFRLSIPRYSFLSSVNFTDHAIAKSLRGLRTLWQELCPLEDCKKESLEQVRGQIKDLEARLSGLKGDAPARKGLEEQKARVRGQLDRLSLTEQRRVMVVPASAGTWATRDIFELIRQFKQNEGFVEPRPSDMTGPFVVAMAAVRKEDREAKVQPVRVVVLATALSLTDEYLEGKVWSMKADGGIAVEEPPRTDAQLVVNSAYWLCGQTQWITGPNRSEPMRDVSPAGMTWMWLVCVVGLPLLVAGAGAVVLHVRSR